MNVTLIFSLERYAEVIDAYLSGIEQAQAAGHDVSTIHSVASFFVSRVDTEVDKRLAAIGTARGRSRSSRRPASPTPGSRTSCSSRSSPTDRAKALTDAGANVQRPLWASTGVKDPSLPDTLYVTELVAPGTVNTMPEKTLEATFDHGEIAGDTVTGAYAGAHGVFDQLAAVGVDFADVTQVLEDEGVDKFIASWHELKDTVADRTAARPRRSPDELSAPPERTRQVRRGRDPARVSSPSLIASGITAGDPSLWGPDAEAEASQRLGWVDAVSVSRPLVAEIEALRAELRREGRHTRRARGHGRLVARPRGHRPDRGRAARHPGLDLARPGARRHRRRCRGRRTDADRARGLVQVGLHRRDRLGQARLRGRVPRSRHRSGRAHRRGHRPGLTAGCVGARRRLPRLQRRPDRRRALLRADGLRSRAERPRGRRHRRAARRGRRDTARGRDRQRRQPALVLAAAIAGGQDTEGALSRKDKLGLVTDGTHIVGLPDWIEQLVAESTGKSGTGILPVVLLPVSPELDIQPRRPAGRPPRRRGEPVPLPRAPRGRSPHQRIPRAPSSSSGSTRRRSPAGCWGSTPSTSPTSSPRRSPRAACSTRGPSPALPRSRWRASRCASRIPHSRHPEPSPACSMRSGARCPKAATCRSRHT